MTRNGDGDRPIRGLSRAARSSRRRRTGKTRPCLIICPDELNRAIQTVIIAPMTTVKRGWPTRVPVAFQGKSGEIALDQLRAVDKSRLGKRFGKIDAAAAQ